MVNILKKVGFVENLTLELAIDNADFENIFRKNVDKPQWFLLDIFSSSKNKYKGTINNDSFELRRKAEFFDFYQMHLTKIKGRLVRKSNKLIIECEINGFHFVFLPVFILAPILYLYFIVTIGMGTIRGEKQNFPFILIFPHAAIILGIPYLIIRKSVGMTTFDFERDIHSMVKGKLYALQQSI